MTRLEALEIVMSRVQETDLLLFTLGKVSREAFETYDRPNNFYVLGSMGLASAVGLGIAHCKPQRKVIVFDGDGSFLMNLGAAAMAAAISPPNFYHIVLDNEAYETTGGQPTISNKVALEKVAQSVGYVSVEKVVNASELESAVSTLLSKPGPVFLLIKVSASVSKVSDKKPTRPDPEALRDRFRRFMNGETET